MAFCSTLILFVALTVVGHVQSRVASGVSVTAPTGNDLDPSCPEDILSNTTTALQFFLEKQKECYKPSDAFSRRLGSAAVTARYQLVMQGACALVPSVRTCMDGVAAEAALCLNKMAAKVVKTARENAEVTISAICDDDSEAVALVFGVEYSAFSTQTKMNVVKCMRGVVQEVLFNPEMDLSLPAYTVKKYRAVKDVRKCVLDIAHREELTMSHFDQLSNNIIGGWKCISPVTEEISVCATL